MATIMPKIEDNDLKIISQKIDWWGLNYYTPMPASPTMPIPEGLSGPSSGAAVHPEKTDIGWEIDSSGLSHVVRDLYATYDLPECYITENGAAYNMGIGHDGSSR
jgi:beta-glucosidase